MSSGRCRDETATTAALSANTNVGHGWANSTAVPRTMEGSAKPEHSRIFRSEFSDSLSVLSCAKADFEDDSDEELLEPSDEEQSATPESPQTELLDVILQQAKLPSKALAEAEAICDLVRSHEMPATVGIRTLVSWAIGASGRGGSLSQAQGKKIAVAAIQVCREKQAEAGIARKGRSAPIDQLVREHGIIALFNRHETVYLGEEDRPYAIMSVSRTKGSVVIAPLDDLEAATEVTPHDLRKDTVEGDWPAEFADL